MSGRAFSLTPDALRDIRRHAADRHSAAAIARVMFCSAGTIENVCRKHGIELVSIPDGLPPVKRHRSGNCRAVRFASVQVSIANEALEEITREARRRGLRPETLIARVVEIVSLDGLFSAVVDK